MVVWLFVILGAHSICACMISWLKVSIGDQQPPHLVSVGSMSSGDELEGGARYELDGELPSKLHGR